MQGTRKNALEPLEFAIPFYSPSRSYGRLLRPQIQTTAPVSLAYPCQTVV